jgi:hypothetical protein
VEIKNIVHDENGNVGINGLIDKYYSNHEQFFHDTNSNISDIDSNNDNHGDNHDENIFSKSPDSGVSSN